MSAASLNAARRAAELDALAAGEEVDLVVVGGGITGAGVALDAASRGLRSRCSSAATSRTARAAGAPSWSTAACATSSTASRPGLGVRARARDADAHRRAAPRPPAAVPDPARRAASAARTAAKTRLGLRIGDGLRDRRAHEPPRCCRRRAAISALEARRLAPALAEAGLRGALLSWDGQLEDDARLVVAVARTAAAHGARILTYARRDRPSATTASTRVDER